MKISEAFEGENSSLKRAYDEAVAPKTLSEILYVTEDVGENKWYVSWGKPMFQGGESNEISKEEALALMSVLNRKEGKFKIGNFDYQDRTIK